MSETFPPRIAPLDPKSGDAAVDDILERWPYNLHKTLAHSPDMMKAWMGFAEHVLLKSSLHERDREIVILRVAWNAQSTYEWGMHAMVARRVGMTDAEIAAIVAGAKSDIWSAHEKALISAVDEIMSGWKIEDATWTVLSKTYTPQNFIDLSMLIGEFILVALTLNIFRITPEPGLDSLPQATNDN